MEWLLGPAARIGVSLAYTELKFTHSDTGLSSEEVYNPETLVGFDETTRHLYPEVELAWDTRRRKSPWEPVTVNSRGSLILAFAGFVHQFDVGGDFVHYGFELQHYWRLGLGPRVLIGRIHGEAVTGDLGQIPMSELPYLGGGDFLRGYPYGRFRDRVATVGSLEYMWSLAAWGSAFVFTDVGRVYGGWNQFTLDDLHVGYGLGLEFYSSDSFYADFAIASSSNGGIALTAEFTPMLNARTRWR
jgi:outer membrane protein assembly factor BamA